MYEFHRVLLEMDGNEEDLVDFQEGAVGVDSDDANFLHVSMQDLSLDGRFLLHSPSFLLFLIVFM